MRGATTSSADALVLFDSVNQVGGRHVRSNAGQLVKLSIKSLAHVRSSRITNENKGSEKVDEVNGLK